MLTFSRTMCIMLSTIRWLRNVHANWAGEYQVHMPFANPGQASSFSGEPMEEEDVEEIHYVHTASKGLATSYRRANSNLSRFQQRISSARQTCMKSTGCRLF